MALRLVLLHRNCPLHFSQPCCRGGDSAFYSLLGLFILVYGIVNLGNDSPTIQRQWTPGLSWDPDTNTTWLQVIVEGCYQPHVSFSPDPGFTYQGDQSTDDFGYVSRSSLVWSLSRSMVVGERVQCSIVCSQILQPPLGCLDIVWASAPLARLAVPTNTPDLTFYSQLLSFSLLSNFCLGVVVCLVFFLPRWIWPIWYGHWKSSWLISTWPSAHDWEQYCRTRDDRLDTSRTIGIRTRSGGICRDGGRIYRPGGRRPGGRVGWRLRVGCRQFGGDLPLRNGTRTRADARITGCFTLLRAVTGGAGRTIDPLRHVALTHRRRDIGVSAVRPGTDGSESVPTARASQIPTSDPC